MIKFSGPLSRRYGTALFELMQTLFVHRDKEFALYSETLRSFAKLFDKKTIQIFKNQSLSLTQKQELLSAMFSDIFDPKISKTFYQYLFNFLMLLVKNKRFSLIHPIFAFYLKLADEYLGIVRVDIVSARTMAKTMLLDFEYNISQNIQKNIVFSNFIDESLQCGFLIRIGSVNIDASLKSYLTKLKESVHQTFS